MAEYRLEVGGVVKEKCGTHIPDSDFNRDWRAYKAWEAAGGVPDPLLVVPVVKIEDRVESSVERSFGMSALVRCIAKKEGITERALIDEIRAEAKE